MNAAFEKLRLGGPKAAVGAGAVAMGLAGEPAAAVTVSIGTSITVSTGGAVWSEIVNSTVDLPLSSLPGATTSFQGFGLDDASLPGVGQTDAFDDFGGIRVNGVAFNHPGDMADLTTTAEGTFITTITPQDIGGIDTSYDFFFDGSSPTLRAVATLTNTTNAPLTAEVSYGGDLGSDDTTQIDGSESGDAVWDITTDGWAISSDGGDGPDPVLTYARFDPGSSEVASDTPSIPGTLDPFGNDEGALADVFTLELDPGETERLMFLVQMSPDVATALSNASDFDSLATLDAAGLLAGLSPAEIGNIVNWDVPEPSTAMVAAGAGLILTMRRRRD